MAVNGSVTDRVLLLDIDFVPYPGLLKALQKIKVARKEAKVVAAFEIIPQTNNAHHLNPKNSDELMQAWSRGLVQTFK